MIKININSKIIVVLLCFLTLELSVKAQNFDPSWSSLQSNYKTPDWFRDAKFGIFMHWGVMSAIDENRDYGGSHYGRYMYGPGEFPADNPLSLTAKQVAAWHKKHYGDPNKVGYKDLIKNFKAEKWNPDSLVAFYKACGAKYIVPVAVHHDNFELFDDSLHRWNSVKMGPKRDILKEWKAAADKQGIRFGVSSHVDRAAEFFQTSRKFDGKDPKYADFYNSNYKIDYRSDTAWMKVWYKRTILLVDKYKPDLIYFDGHLPGTSHGLTYGLDFAAHFYNNSIKNHNGKLEAVINLKFAPDKRGYVFEIERGQAETLQDLPWQTDTDLSGGWFYRKTEPQFTTDVLVGNLIDIVSKNGNLLLNVGLRGDGTLPENQANILRQMGNWLKINGEGIYSSRPWMVYGEGPTRTTAGAFKEQKESYTSEDIRFTTRGGFLYAFVLKIPEKEVNIKSLSGALTFATKVENVQLLGNTEKLIWAQTKDALNIQLPKKINTQYALAFKIKLAEKGNKTPPVVSKVPPLVVE